MLCLNCNKVIHHNEMDLCSHCGEPLPEQSPWASGNSPADHQMAIPVAPGIKMVFVCVYEGLFLMGSDDAVDNWAFRDEFPMHAVNLGEYWIGKYPVTNHQYQAFIEASGRKGPEHWEGSVIPEGKEDHPVFNVSWHDARTFCRWLNEMSGEVVRLPTEAEWEKAARGVDGRIYPWGNQKPDAALCNFNDLYNGTTRVGKFSPQGDSPFGCTDMAGNVWEWVSSLKADYNRNRGDPDYTRKNGGFRCVCIPP
jgi:serine/threonine-protein kinase